MKYWIVGLLLIASLMALTGCSGDDNTAQAAESAPANQAGGGQFGGEPFQSAFLNQDYEAALPVVMQLSLGSIQLEGTDKAITPDQAKKLLPFWQALQSGNLQNAAERNTVLKQIELTLTADQMNTIVSLKLTFQTLNQWAESQGIELPQGRFGGGNGPFANMSEEERARFREEMRNLSQEERQARLRELGIEVGERQGGGQGRRGGRFNVLMGPLIELLITRAAE